WTDQSQTGGDTDDDAVRGQIFDADGIKSGQEFLVNTATAGAQNASTVAGLLDGRFVVAWSSGVQDANDNFSSTVHAQVFDSNGTKFGTELALSTAPDANQHTPTVAALADGRFVIGWADFNAGLGDSSGGVHGQIFDARDAAVHLAGTAGDDDYVGTRFNDTMQGDSGGDDQFDGGAGDDTAIYVLSHDQYTLQA